jgi:hypothetical protein
VIIVTHQGDNNASSERRHRVEGPSNPEIRVQDAIDLLRLSKPTGPDSWN